MPLQNPSPAIEITTGNYTGNGAANRAIPHSLSREPKMVFIIGNSASRVGYLFDTVQLAFDRPVAKAVTGWTTTNFYVSMDSGTAADFNQSSIGYKWVAIS